MSAGGSAANAPAGCEPSAPGRTGAAPGAGEQAFPGGARAPDRRRIAAGTEACGNGGQAGFGATGEAAGRAVAGEPEEA